MQLDKKNLERVFAMNDDDLKKTVNAVAKEKGLSLPNISDADIAKIRAALGSISSTSFIPEEVLRDASAGLKKEGDKK